MSRRTSFPICRQRSSKMTPPTRAIPSYSTTNLSSRKDFQPGPNQRPLYSEQFGNQFVYSRPRSSVDLFQPSSSATKFQFHDRFEYDNNNNNNSVSDSGYRDCISRGSKEMANLPQHDVLTTVSHLYGVTFPPTVQTSVLQFILTRLRSASPSQNLPEPILDQEAVTFFNDFIAELDRISLTASPGSTAHAHLSTAIGTLRQLNPLLLYTSLLECLEPEESPPPIDQQTSILQSMVLGCESQIGTIVRMPAGQREPRILQLARDLWTTLDRATDLANQLIGTFLCRWRISQDQRQGGDAAAMLDTIQRACEVLAGAVWSVREQVQAIPVILGTADIGLSGLLDRTRDLLGMLVTKCFVVVMQPPRVIKTNTKYTVGIRHLLGRQLNEKMVGLEQKTSIVSESQARAIQQTNVFNEENSGDLAFDEGSLGYDQESGHLRAIYRNLLVKRIRRQERRGAESVTDEKFAFLFHLSFAVGDLSFRIWTISQPVVVIVHGIQETAATATIIWDNAFADPGRIPFEVSERMAWNLLGEMLNQRFRTTMDRPLSEANLHFLAVKATRRNLPFPIPATELVTRAQFCRDMIPARPFTFWEWFYAALKVIRDAFRELWNAGHLVGFIDRASAEAELQPHPAGSFLLRFSDSQLGGISIAYVTDDGTVPRIQHINPCSGKNAIDVLNIIRDLPQLKFIYPDGVPKQEAFGRFYPTRSQTVDGYVPAVPAPQQANGSNQVANSPNPVPEAAVPSPVANGQQQFDDLKPEQWNQIILLSSSNSASPDFMDPVTPAELTSSTLNAFNFLSSSLTPGPSNIRSPQPNPVSNTQLSLPPNDHNQNDSMEF